MSARSTLAALACVALLTAGAPASGAGDDSFIRTGAAPPPGFEDLTGPMDALVDVYFGDRLVGVTMARVELDALVILAPDELLSMLPALVEPDRVAAALTGPLPTNAHRVCRYGQTDQCGDLDPDVAGIVFDESRFRLDVFVAARYLEARPVHASRFLPEATADFATLHRVDFSVSGGAGLAEDGFNLGATSLFARRAERINARYDIADDGFTTTELSWQRDRPGWRYEAGSFRSVGRSVAFVGEQDIVGVRAGGSLDTRADLQTADATPLFLFLNQRSRVDIRRDGRLLDSRYYDAGNQQLDTTRLPDGAYDIQVTTRDGAGREREQTFFFVRTARLPPIDQPLYYAEAGRLAQAGTSVLPRLQGGNWLRAGVARRLSAHLGVEIEAVHAGETSLLQAGLYMFGRGWQLEGGVLGSSASDRGLSLRGHLRRGELSVGMDWRHVSSGRTKGDPDVFDPVPESYTQGTMTLGLPLWHGRFFARAQVDQRGTTGNNAAFGLAYTRPLLRRRGYSLDLDVDTTHDGDEAVLRIGVQGHWRRGAVDTVVRPHLAAHFGGADDGVDLLLDARATRDDRDTPAGDLTSSVFTTSTGDERTLGAGLVSESDVGYANVELQHTRRDDGAGLGYSANARFSVVTDEGTVAWGGRRGELAAVILEIDGVTDTEFAVLVDRQPAGTVRAGRPSVLSLRPYDTYELRLEPRGETFVGFDERPRTVTLYPGNVETLRFEAKALTVVVGQLVDEQGQPVTDARFDTGSGYAGTDENGWFQVEIDGRDPLTVRRPGAADCVVHWPPFEADRGLAVLDALPCRGATTDAD